MKIAITYDTEMPESQMSVMSGMIRKFSADPLGTFLEYEDPGSDGDYTIRRGAVAVIHDEARLVHEYEVAAVLYESKWNVVLQYKGEKEATEEQLRSDNLSVHEV